MPIILDMWPFLKSIFTGTIVGGALPLLITVPLGVANLIQPLTGAQDIIASLYLAACPLIFVFIVVTICCFLIGIPVFLVLRVLKSERWEIYVPCGATAGFIVPFLALSIGKAEGGYWISILGLMSGAATAWTWSQYRCPIKSAGEPGP